MRNTHKLNLADVKPDPGQPRKNKPASYIRELAGAIKERADTERAIDPITVRHDPANEGKYIIIMGECRYLAHITDPVLSKAGVIEAFIRETVQDAKTIYLDQISENLNRLNMGIMETVRAYGEAINKGATVEEVAKSFGKSAAGIQDDLELLRLPEYIQNDVDSGGLPKTVARQIARQPNDARMGKAYKAAKKGKTAAEMMTKLRAYEGMTQQQTLDDMLNAKDSTPDEMKAAGKRLDKLMEAVSVFANNAGDKGGLAVKARSRKITEIKDMAKEMIKQANMILENCRIVEEYHTKKAA